MGKKTILILFVIVIIVSAFIFIFIKYSRFMKIDSCLDKGGRWNYEMNECEDVIDLELNRLEDYYWSTRTDTFLNTEIIEQGCKMLIDSFPIDQLVWVLNRRSSIPKINFVNLSNDTITIEIIEDEYLGERMGSTGANCYIGETVFTLTEDSRINYVNIEMEEGSHASPGVYARNFFNYIEIAE